AALALKYNFNSAQRCLHCICHMLNLVGQALMSANDQTTYENAHEHCTEEELYVHVGAKIAPLGSFFDDINYVKTLQQYELFQDCQRATNAYPSVDKPPKTLEPVKPVHHINRVTIEDSNSIRSNNKLPDAPSWMRSDGLTAADWAVITEYQETQSHSKELLNALKAAAKTAKTALYTRLYQCTSTSLTASRSDSNCTEMLTLTLIVRRSSRGVAPTGSSIDDAISAYLRGGGNADARIDKFEDWKFHEPELTAAQYKAHGSPVLYWIQLRLKYPDLAQLAIDIMTIPASSGDLWVRAGFKTPYTNDEMDVTDEEVMWDQNMCEWDTSTL
ncbi:hypothetical protein RJ035_000774, partial [Blastomyces gilchristii]